MRQCAANRTVKISQLQTAREDRLDPRSRHNAQLTETRHGPGELPVGNSDAHAALNDLGKCGHIDLSGSIRWSEHFADSLIAFLLLVGVALDDTPKRVFDFSVHDSNQDRNLSEVESRFNAATRSRKRERDIRRSSVGRRRKRGLGHVAP